jgi:hypothetical protein
MRDHVRGGSAAFSRSLGAVPFNGGAVRALIGIDGM